MINGTLNLQNLDIWQILSDYNFWKRNEFVQFSTNTFHIFLSYFANIFIQMKRINWSEWNDLVDVIFSCSLAL